MKRTLRIAGLVLLGLVVLLAALPLLFKNQIKARLDGELAKNLHADVRYGDVGLSLLRHFPNVTLSLENLAVTGRPPFRGDTLLAARELGFSFNALSLVRGEKIKVNAVDLDRPVVGLRVLPDGQSNYAIYQPDTTRNESDSDTTKTHFRLQIKEWTVANGRFTYDSRPDSLLVRLAGVNHTGSGDFTQDVFDLVTDTRVARATVAYGGTEYLTGKALDADARLTINLTENRYTFKNNVFKINDFPLSFDGWVALPDSGADSGVTMDVAFKTETTDFKNLLSVVPGVYTERFRDLQADGRVAFDGAAKGTLLGDRYPTFRLDLTVADGKFHYAGLPQPVENIQLDLKASNATDRLETMVLDLRQLSANLGRNPIRGRMRLQGLKTFDVDADVQAKADLAELTKLFPIDSLELKGLFDLNLKANGHYGEGRFPVVNGAMKLADGYVRSLRFAEPIEDVTFTGSLRNTTGQAADTELTLADLRMRVQDEPFVARGTVRNFDDYTWDIRAKGALDLTRLTAIFPLPDTKLAGRVDADVESRGRYSDVKAKRYANLPTSGTAVLRNVVYETPAYPRVRITDAALRFSPQRLDVPEAIGFVGSSDVDVNGFLTNYLGYFLDENQKLGGTLSLVSRKFNVNEWLSDNGKVADSSAHLTAVKVPENLALTLNTAIGEARYDRMPLRNLTGSVTVANGAVKLEKLNFMALGGQFQTSGLYDTRDITKPKFDFALNLANVQIAEAYQHLTVVRALLPLAQYVLGNVSSQFKLSGLLGPDMMPQLNTLDGAGLIRIIQAAVRDNPVLERLVQHTKLSELQALRLKNVLMKTEIIDGKVQFQPFDVAFDLYKITIRGGNGFDGALDYKLAFDVPSGAVGQAFQQTFASWTGKLPINVDRVKFDLALGGTFKNPQLRFDGSSTAKNLKETLTAGIQQKLNELNAKAQTEADRLKQEAEARIRAEQERLRQQAEARSKSFQDSLDAVLNARRREAENRAKDFLNEQKSRLFEGLARPRPAPRDSTKQ